MRLPSTPSEAERLPLPGRMRPQGMAPSAPGIALSGAIAAASWGISRIEAIQMSAIGMLVIALTLGMVVGNAGYAKFSSVFAPGVALAKQKLLRLGIILYGLRLTFSDIGEIGFAGVIIDALMVLSTFGLALLVGRRLLQMDRNTVVLIGAGSSICGAAAVLATEPVVKARTDQVAVAVSTVVIFGTLATYVYPLLYGLHGHWSLLPASAGAFGVYAGSTIHEVAQVVAVARTIDAGAADTALIAKMVRVMMLCPFLLVIAICGAIGKDARETHLPGGARMPDLAVLVRAIPWFAVGFIAVVALNSLLPLPAGLIEGGERVSMLLLATAMSALGLTTHVSTFRIAGIRSVLLAATLAVWLIVGGAWINHAVPRLFV